MFSNFYKNKKGVTLVELIIVLAILTMVIGSAYSLLFFGNRTFAGGNIQYNAQSNTRLIADYITKEIRFSTDVSIQSVSLSETEIANIEPYSYIYIKGGSLYHYLYDSVTGSHNSRVFQGDISEVNSSFNMVNDSTLGIIMTSIGNNEDYFIDTEVNLPNFKLMSASILGTSDLALRYSKDASVTPTPSPTDPRLETLTITAGTLSPSFNTAVTSYTVTLPVGSTIVPTVIPTSKDGATVTSITQASNLEGTVAERTATVIVTSTEDSTKTNIYKVIFSVGLSSDATLGSLTVGGVAVGLVPGQTTYTIELPYGTSIPPSVSATSNHAGASVGTPTHSTGKVEVEVTAEDTTTVKAYIVNYTIPTPVSISSITLTTPVKNAIAQTEVNTPQFTGTVTWDPTLPGSGKFGNKTIYTATITLTAKPSYTLSGVGSNFFTVPGATSIISNTANSGVVKATFPETSN